MAPYDSRALRRSDSGSSDARSAGRSFSGHLISGLCKESAKTIKGLIVAAIDAFKAPETKGGHR